MSKKAQYHTANFIISRFLLSKYSRKKKYKLNIAKRGFIRYIADCIDLTFKKHKKFQAKLSQKQIATQNCVSLKTIWRLSKELVKARILKHDDKNQIYSLGRVLIAYVKMTQGKEVRQNDVGLRYTSKRRISNSSNITNTKKLPSARKDEKKSATADVEKQSNSFGVIPETKEESQRRYEARTAYLKTKH